MKIKPIIFVLLFVITDCVSAQQQMTDSVKRSSYITLIDSLFVFHSTSTEYSGVGSPKKTTRSSRLHMYYFKVGDGAYSLIVGPGKKFKPFISSSPKALREYGAFKRRVLIRRFANYSVAVGAGVVIYGWIHGNNNNKGFINPITASGIVLSFGSSFLARGMQPSIGRRLKKCVTEYNNFLSASALLNGLNPDRIGFYSNPKSNGVFFSWDLK